jgi:hypothetical protein
MTSLSYAPEEGTEMYIHFIFDLTVYFYVRHPDSKLPASFYLLKRQLLESQRSLQQSSLTTIAATSQDTPVTSFEDRLVCILADQDQFCMFLSLTTH